MKHTITILFLFGCLFVNAQKNYSITVEFSGMKSNKGNLYVALYNKKDDFLKKEYKGVIVEIKNKKATAVFKELPKGKYAVSAFHDANDNKKMDTNFIGIPKEPIGISNNARGFMGPPKFKKANFLVDKHLSLSILVK